MIAWLMDLLNLWRKPPPQWDPDFLCDMDCPDTQPTTPGLLDEGHHVAP